MLPLQRCGSPDHCQLLLCGGRGAGVSPVQHGCFCAACLTTGNCRFLKVSGGQGLCRWQKQCTFPSSCWRVSTPFSMAVFLCGSTICGSHQHPLKIQGCLGHSGLGVCLFGFCFIAVNSKGLCWWLAPWLLACYVTFAVPVADTTVHMLQLVIMTLTCTGVCSCLL